VTGRTKITLCVVTRDRAETLARCLLPGLRDLLAEGFPIVVVDQSSGSETAGLVGDLPGATYLRSEPGLSRGRNVAIGSTKTPLLAFTDDDVSLPQRWLGTIAALFDQTEDAGAVCGRASTPEGELLPGKSAGIYRWPASPFGLGSGFNLAFRREALDAAGPFDEELGAGARYRAAEDTDMLYRILRAGWSVVCSDTISVVHHDTRTGGDERKLHHGYGLGAGAQTAKHLSAGDSAALRIALREIAAHLAWFARSILTLRLRPARLQIAFAAGLLAGFRERRRAQRL